ncbi:hypothetical protein ABWK46_22585 [Peribacillus frigoritolerans]|uniref:hypothetical protein n=1 Tax=Peribacillus frigoritolerans TaxID=450367 RepID=UPI0033946927
MAVAVEVGKQPKLFHWLKLQSEGGFSLPSILKEKIQGPVAWKGIDLAKNDSWIYYCT